MGKSLFGKYNPLIDEVCQILTVSPFLIFIYYLRWVKPNQVLVLFLASVFLIDLDHLLNPLVVKLLKIEKLPGQNKLELVTTLLKGEDPFVINGYNIQILHSIDLFIISSLIVFFLSHNLYFSLSLFLCLVIHLFWDFLVYPHSLKGLFLFLRIRSRFKLGERHFLTGLIFDKDTLLY